MKRPALHFTPTSNWMNDPNGLIYFGGKYHLFYQHFPYAPKWGRMHWGHAVSDDMIHWEHLPIALYPSKIYDKDGVFSGSAIEKDGKMYLTYTAISYHDYDPENTNLGLNGMDSAQALLISEDGYTFNNDEKKLVIPMITDKTLGDPQDARDPKVWEHNGKYYLIMASKTMEDGKDMPELLFYESDDAINWQYKNRVQKPLGFMWECPDVFSCPETVVVFSPMRIGKNAQTDLAYCAIVDFDNDSCEMNFELDDLRLVDYGEDYYAPQSFVDKDGNRVQIGWLRMKAPVMDDNGTAWMGAFTMPRVVTTENGKIITRLHPSLRAEFEVFDSVQNTDRPYCIRKTMTEGDELNVNGYILRKTADELIAVRGEEKFPAPAKGDALVEVYVDMNIIETFINDGEAVIAHEVSCI
ncbi:MAG: glycoside hydrolase family 32 protein [Clostridia bacterium]|nr:glycoside hydrolase family 32 protein [Clostridia bacterium]